MHNLINRIALVAPATLVLILNATSSLDGAGQPAGPATATPRAALFTDAQATSGEALYQQSCAACHGATLTRRHGAAADRPGVRGELGQPARHARRSLLHHADDDAAASVQRAVAAGSCRGVRLHPEDERLSVGSVAADRRLGAAEGARLQGATARARPRARPLRRSSPAPRARRPATTGPDQATLTASARSTDWLFHTHDYAGTRFSPLAGDQRDERRAPCAGVHVPGRRAGQFSNRSDRPQRRRCT